MPNTSGRPVKKGKKGRGKASKGRAPPRQLNAQQLYQQAQIALQYDDCESARDALRQAVQLEPTNLEVLEAYGSLLAEMGDPEQASLMLQRAVELSPDVGHEKYMYLGQLLEGEEALRMTRQGIALLQKVLDQAVSGAAAAAAAAGQEDGAAGQKKRECEENMEEEEEGEEEEEEEPGVSDLQAQLCSALCSLAELLMGQAETVEAMGSEAEELLARARATCSLSPEPGQTLASLRYEQGRPEEALQELRSSMQLWFKPQAGGDSEDEAMEKEGEGEGEGGDSGDELGQEASGRHQASKSEAHMADDHEEDEGEEDEDDDEDDSMQPSYEFRFECAKLLLELDDSTEAAIQVLEDLVEEDDSNPHTWHLLGMAYYGGHMFEEAQEIYDKGMKLLRKLKVTEDDELYADYADLKGAIEEASTAAAEC